MRSQLRYSPTIVVDPSTTSSASDGRLVLVEGIHKDYDFSLINTMLIAFNVLAIANTSHPSLM